MAARWFRVETGLAVASGLLLTLVATDWIEIVFRVDPDQGSGSLEWALVAGFATAALVFSGAVDRHLLRRQRNGLVAEG